MTEIRSQFISKADESLSPRDHQSTCFICTKNLFSLDIKGEQSYEREYSIRIIFKHLKISLLTQLHKADTQLIDVVPFCERCYEIFSTLSIYYADLEVLKMRIYYFLTELNKLTVVEDVKEKCGLISTARKQLKIKLREKCKSIDQTGPFVILPQQDIEQIRGVKYPKTDDNFDCISEVEDKTEETDDDKSDSQCHISDVDYESDISRPIGNNLKRSKISSRHSSISRSKDGTHRCLECNREFKCKDSLLEHSPLFHPEKHFPPQTKSDNLTPQQYKMYLMHLLNTEVDSCGSYKAGGFNCSYCPKTFKNKRKHTFRLHLTKEHQDELLEKLDKLRADVSTEQIFKKFKNPIRSQIIQPDFIIENNFKLHQFCKTKNSMKFVCEVCEVRTTSLRKHEAIHHPEQFLISKRFKNVSLDEFKMYCGYLMSKQVENFVKCQEDGKVRFKCPYCPNSYLDSYSCRNHLILGHVNLLSVEIEKLQETMKPEELKSVKTLQTKAKRYDRLTKNKSEVETANCEICDVCLTKRSLTIHMRKNHPDEHLSAFEECSICKKRFKHKWWFDFHKTGCHAHIIFEKWKGEMTTVVQFKSYCQYMLEMEIRDLGQVGTTDGKVRFKCSYCTTTFSDTKFTQIHLVRDHKEILGSRLVDLQKRKTVDEVEQDVVIKREKSEERFGEGEEEYFEASEVFCEKRAVKVEESEIFTGNHNGNNEIMDLEDLNEMSLDNMSTIIENNDCKMEVETVLTD